MSSAQELASQHAPLLHLHPAEKYAPMDPDAFVRCSRLWRARGNRAVGAFDAQAETWIDIPARNAPFGVSLERLATWDALNGPDDAAWSRRPHDRTGAADGEQYVIEHPDARPTAPFDPENPPPCYYYVQPWKRSTLVSYWLFYGYSEFLGNIAHQGDWEHVSLVVRRDGSVTSAFFAVHEGKYYVQTNDLTFRDGRLVAYSAKGRHATWWKEGKHAVGLTFLQRRRRIEDLPEIVIEEGVIPELQDETAAGPLWDLKRNLHPLDTQLWRRFGGAWGGLGAAPHATGPLGPWFKRLINPKEKVVLE